MFKNKSPILAQRSVFQEELNLTNVQKDQFLALEELYWALGSDWERPI
ncbi:MAG: hypothetical protein ACO1N1_04925 [Dyadobacter fermentans]